MVWRWILGILLLLTALLCWTRAGALITLGDAVCVDMKLGWLRFRIFSGTEKPAKKKKTKKKKENASAEEDAGKKKSSQKPALADIWDAVRTLAPPLKKALGRACRGIHIAPMRLSLVIGGQQDPAAAAKLYGEINAGIWSGMPVLERLLDIPDPGIHTEVDFNTEKTQVTGTVGISIRIGTALAVGFGIAFPALRWFLRYRKKRRKNERLPASGKSGTRAA